MNNAMCYKELNNKLNTGKKCVMVTTLLNGSVDIGSAFKKECISQEMLQNSSYTNKLDETLLKNVLSALETGKLQYIKTDDKVYLIEPCFPEPRLIVFGGGHIAKPLTEFGAKLGFLVTVIDDRPSFANKPRFPEAEKVICESFEKCFDLIDLNPSTFAVIVTRGHRHDMDCLRQVLKYDNAYIGMIGSKRRVRSVMEQLSEEGYSHEQLSKVNAPIGLDIGAITPEEIAISIIAQVISYRRYVNTIEGGISDVKVTWPELDKAVLDELSKEKDDPKAVITVVSTKGSAPRKAGAKMIVWPDGKILGSIGGGCSESQVIVTARDIIAEGGFKEMTIDMTGEFAEDEGMVCGGIMQVVIEAYNA